MQVPNPVRLQKLRIEPADRQGSRRSGEAGPFDAMFNPNEYTLTYRNTPRRPRTLTPDSRNIEHGGQETQLFQVRLLLDGTGAAEAISQRSGDLSMAHSVQQRVEQFLNTCYRVVEKLHRPNKLHIHWGIIDFFGWLQSVQIHYTLFDQKGIPLRAELECQFIGATDQGMVQLSSPDLTHVREVRAGDTLPLLAKEIYGSSRYYLLIADANGLDDFRNLQPGTVLHFPPLVPQ